LHKMKSLCFVSGQGANHRNTDTVQGCGDDLQHRPGAKGASFMCSYLRDDTPGGAAASPRADDRWHNAPCTKPLPQPQSHPPTGPAVSRKVFQPTHAFRRKAQVSASRAIRDPPTNPINATTTS